MKENEISAIIIDCCYKIHQRLGPGLLESVYEEIIAFELSKRRLVFEKQKAIPLKYGDIKFDIGFRSDFIVEKKINRTQMKRSQRLTLILYISYIILVYLF